MFTINENIQSNCVKAGAVVQVEVVQVCQAAGRLKSDRQTTYLPAPPVLACVLCDLTFEGLFTDFHINKLAKLGDALAISKCKTVTHSLTH